MPPRTESEIVTKATLRAAVGLGLSSMELARIIGLSNTTIARMRSGNRVLNPQRKPYELALLLIRSYLSLDAIVGSDVAAMRAWVHATNGPLGESPISRMMSVAGLTEVVAYLDSRRALI